MAIRGETEESFVVEGDRGQWISICEESLKKAGFTNVRANKLLGQIDADYKKVTVWGVLLITLAPEGQFTRINAKATANVDNIYALFSSPGQKILNAFKANLG